MTYTKEDIEKIKSDPMMRLLCLFADKDLDDIISEIELEHESKGNLHWNKKDGTTEEPKPDIKINLKPAESLKRKVFPIGKDEYSFIVKCVCSLNENIAKAKQLGFSDINTKDLTLVGAPLAIIYTVLRNLISSDFAGRFINGIPNEGSDYFWKLYDDQTRVY